jgi:hypothetical protein
MATRFFAPPLENDLLPTPTASVAAAFGIQIFVSSLRPCDPVAPSKRTHGERGLRSACEGSHSSTASLRLGPHPLQPCPAPERRRGAVASARAHRSLKGKGVSDVTAAREQVAGESGSDAIDACLTDMYGEGCGTHCDTGTQPQRAVDGPRGLRVRAGLGRIRLRAAIRRVGQYRRGLGGGEEHVAHLRVHRNMQIAQVVLLAAAAGGGERWTRGVLLICTGACLESDELQQTQTTVD